MPVQTYTRISTRSRAHEVGPTRRQHATRRLSAAAAKAVAKAVEPTLMASKKGVAKLMYVDAEIEAEAKETIKWFDKKGQKAVSGNDLLDLALFYSKGAPVDAGAIEWIMAIADKNEDKKIDKHEFGLFKSALATYLEARKRIQRYLDEFDLNKDGKFQKDELSKLLTSLNDGLPVPDWEVEWVMRSTGTKIAGKGERCIAVPDLEDAIDLWYNNVHPHPSKEVPLRDRKKGGVVGHAVAGMNSNEEANLMRKELDKSKLVDKSKLIPLPTGSK